MRTITYDEILDIRMRLYAEQISPEHAAEFMASAPMVRLINSYVNKSSINKLVPYSEEDIMNISEIIKITQFIENNTGVDTNVTNTDYDTLYEIMLNNTGMDEVSAPVLPSAEVFHHTYPDLRGTLDKTYYLEKNPDKVNQSRKSLDEWIKSTENEYYKATGRGIDLNEEEAYIQPKMDGASGILEYDENNDLDIALTRGDVVVNEAKDITSKMKVNYSKGPYPKIPGKYGVKTEIMVSEDTLHTYNKKYGTDYKSSRSLASSILNSSELDDRAHLLVPIKLRMQPLGGEEEIVLSDIPYIRCKLGDRERIDQFAEEHRYVKGFRTDGAVIYIINKEIREVLGRKGAINKFEVAYKFTEESAYSTIKDIVFETGLFGRLTPVAIFEPVKLKGNTVKRVSLGSLGRMTALRLAKGDRVKILYDIIPYLTLDATCEPSGNPIIEPPSQCPICGKELEYNMEDMILKCKNPDCDCNKIGQIINYLQNMKIQFISFATVNKLYEVGKLHDITDLYKLTLRDLMSLDGFQEKSARRIINEINAKKSIYPHEILGSIGIEDIGQKTFEKICRKYSLDDVLWIGKEKDLHSLTKIEGIGDIKGFKIIQGLRDKMDKIEYLLEIMDIKEYPNEEDEVKFTVCFTKITNPMVEDEIEALTIKNGGKVVDDYGKKVTYLVVDNYNVDSGKVKKAKKWVNQILSVEDFKRKFK